ncbi:MFS transporter [Actinomadura madurae]|uniref:MFS transporter n=1 Tax=Actinomadura madurae TaxID=1993 RepID=UPI000D841EF0|nr:MFS transporter [Actinomadura madurae]SPT59323.1 cyanate transporter [Actinomadura madurae]
MDSADTDRAPAAATAPASSGRGTLALYGTFGCLGYLLTALGAVLPELREERGLPRAEAALYPSAFALGLVVVGLVGHRLAERLGRYALPTALTALVGGAALLAAGGGRLGTAAGALVLGLGGAGLVQLVPAALRAAHQGDGTIQIGQANAVSSAASVLSPVIIGVTLAHNLGWRAAFAIPPALLAATILLPLTRTAAPSTNPTAPTVPNKPATPEGSPALIINPTAAPTVPTVPAPAVPSDPVVPSGPAVSRGPAVPGDPAVPSGSVVSRGPAVLSVPVGDGVVGGWGVLWGFWGRWVDLVLAVGVEFCMVFWAADFLRSVKEFGAGTATTLSAAFVLGMAVGRAVAGPAVRFGGRPDRLLAFAALVGIGGFAILWTSPAPVAVAGLLITGLGVALLYPVILGQALAAWESQPVRAAARCALASGVAIGVAPLALGTLADLTTLRAAVFVAPALLVVLLVRCAWRLKASMRFPLSSTVAGR